MLYVLFAPEPEAAIERTVEIGERLHVDLGADGLPVGLEILYPTLGGIDLEPVGNRFGLEVRLPFDSRPELFTPTDARQARFARSPIGDEHTEPAASSGHAVVLGPLPAPSLC